MYFISNVKQVDEYNGNGVLLVTFPISQQTQPDRLVLDRITPAHGERKGNAGHPPRCIQP